MERSEILERIYALVNSEKVQDPLAKEGTLLLSTYSPDDLYKVFRRVVMEREPAKEVVVDLSADPKVQEKLVPALRRLLFVGVNLANDIRSAEREPVTREDPKNLEFSPAHDFNEVWEALESGPVDSIKDLELCCKVQKLRLKQMMKQVAAVGSGAFLSANTLNGTMETLRKLEETLFAQKVRLGVLDEVPRKVEMQLQGAVQTALGGGVTVTDKEVMERFATDLIDSMESRYACADSD